MLEKAFPGKSVVCLDISSPNAEGADTYGHDDFEWPLYLHGRRIPGFPSRTERSGCVSPRHLESAAGVPLRPLPEPRAGGGLILWRNRLIFSGDVVRSGNATLSLRDFGTTWALDLNHPAKGWVNQNVSMPNPRNHKGAMSVCGKYFWLGGQRIENEQTGN